MFPLWRILDLALVHWWSCHQHPAMYLLQMFSTQSNNLSLWFDMTITRTDIGKARKKNVCEDEQRTADPANRGSTRGACQGAAYQGLRAFCSRRYYGPLQIHQSPPWGHFLLRILGLTSIRYVHSVWAIFFSQMLSKNHSRMTLRLVWKLFCSIPVETVGGRLFHGGDFITQTTANF